MPNNKHNQTLLLNKITVFVRVSYLLTSFVDVSFLECEPSNFPVIRNIQTQHIDVV